MNIFTITSTLKEIISIDLLVTSHFLSERLWELEQIKISACNKRPMESGPTRLRMMSEESRKINYRQRLVNSNGRSLTEGHTAFDTYTEPIPFNRNEAVEKFVSLLDSIFQGK